MPEPATIEPALCSVLREAGDLALRYFRTEIRQWTKGASSPVSEADLAVDDLLRQRLRGLAPDYGWLSEESADDPSRLAARRLWVVDPIDGTRSFLEGREDWGISVALVENGRPILGGLYIPATAEIFTAQVGGGAFRNGQPIQVSGAAGLTGAAIGGPSKILEKIGISASGAAIAPRIGSLALRLARVAEGSLDGAIASAHSHDWDLAAADLLVHEAGGVMTTRTGAGLLYNRPTTVHDVLAAAGGAVHARLLASLANHGTLA